MTEKELGNALLRLDAAGPIVADPRVMTERILDRDRRRVRRLTWLTVGVWLFAAGLVLFLLVEFGLMLPELAKLKNPANPARVTPTQRETMVNELELGFKLSLVVISLTVGALSLAGLCTLGLVLATRRATLRQVNANLVEIGEQLKQLRQQRARQGDTLPK
jgi:uncharacterized membrane protein YbhN (UPF0104 family)